MKKVILLILDGFGIRENENGNAIKMSSLPNLTKIFTDYSVSELEASGEEVGLPAGVSGNSEVGHFTLGSGRIVKQPYTIINESIKDKSFFENDVLLDVMDHVNENNSTLHLVGLLSDSGIHSSIEHFYAALALAKIRKVNSVVFHFITDGKDSKTKANVLISNFMEKVNKLGLGTIGTICGRYYALDMTIDYKRTKMYYDLLLEGRGVEANNIYKVIEKCYEKKLSDEYLPPIKTKEFKSVDNGDVLMLLNFSKENQYQLLNSLCNKEFDKFNIHNTDVKVYSLFEIDKELNRNYLFEIETYNHTLTEYIADLGLTQAHIFESVKESSMNYYLTGKRRVELKGCDRYIIPSPKVDSFDMKPEMDALSLAKTTIKCMEKDYDFIMVNFANPDEVGHTGNYQATINGLQAIDVCLGKILEIAEENFYKVIIVSSHGKADTIIDRQNNIITKNTLSPVPFMIVDNKVKLNNGDLTSFAPTLLKYMDIALPKEMKNSEILLNKK